MLQARIDERNAKRKELEERQKRREANMLKGSVVQQVRVRVYVYVCMYLFFKKNTCRQAEERHMCMRRSIHTCAHGQGHGHSHGHTVTITVTVTLMDTQSRSRLRSQSWIQSHGQGHGHSHEHTVTITVTVINIGVTSLNYLHSKFQHMHVMSVTLSLSIFRLRMRTHYVS